MVCLSACPTELWWSWRRRPDTSSWVGCSKSLCMPSERATSLWAPASTRWYGRASLVSSLGRVLDERGAGPTPPASERERALFAALDAGGLPRPRRQMALPSRGAIEGLVDAAYPDCRLILESDGRRWHARINDLKRDHERDAEAARVGWQTLRFVYEQIIHDPHEVCAVVADVRAVRSTAGPPRQREAIAAPAPNVDQRTAWTGTFE